MTDRRILLLTCASSAALAREIAKVHGNADVMVVPKDLLPHDVEIPDDITIDVPVFDEFTPTHLVKKGLPPGLPYSPKRKGRHR